MKVKQFKNDTLSVTSETKEETEKLYEFITKGKHSYSWFQDRIGKEIIAYADGNPRNKFFIKNKEHALSLFMYYQQDLNQKFSDIPTTFQNLETHGNKSSSSRQN